MREISLLKALCLTKKASKMSDEEIKELQAKRFRKLFAYVKEHSPYFRNLYKDLDENTPLKDFPITNKQMMNENFDSWMTDPNITKQRVEEFMSHKENIGGLLDNKYHVYTTSGSTGTPCIVLYDKTAFNVASSIGILRSFARKVDFRKFMKTGGKTAALFADDGFYLGCGSIKYNLKRFKWKKNKMITMDVRKPMRDIVDALNHFKPSMIGCYPSSLELIALEAEKRNLHIKPSIIMTGGEKLSEDVREHLRKTFGCYVQTNYSCTEGGTMACECSGKHFHVNDDWIILEAVDKDNNPVPFGTQSAKVLLTNLSNKTCPFIRFEITDRITVINKKCVCGKTRPYITLEGRTDDILTFENGVKIAPLSLYAILKEVKGIQRFQLIQHENDQLELRLVCLDKADGYTRCAKVLKEYLSANNVDSHIYLSSEDPKASPISGKFKHIISYKKEDKEEV